jgi:hypothetical protein
LRLTTNSYEDLADGTNCADRKRWTWTDYLLTKGYTDRNIIGLPSETRAWGKNDLTNNLEQVSRVTYGYDEGTFSQEPNQIIAPTRHDTANYGSAFTKRGNPTSTTRHDVTGQTAAVTSQVRYDIAGRRSHRSIRSIERLRSATNTIINSDSLHARPTAFDWIRSVGFGS